MWLTINEKKTLSQVILEWVPYKRNKNYTLPKFNIAPEKLPSQ